MKDLTEISLFAGIVGMSLAAQWAGFRTTLFVEIDPFCQRVLRKHWPDVPLIGDIRDVRGKEYSATIITGGFPCQPVSQAGQRRGKEDDRWLWPDMLRVISEVRPTWVVAENVTGLLTMGFYDCLSDLESEGYETISFVIPACAVGAPHRRDRIFIVANCKSSGFGQGLSKITGLVLSKDTGPQELEGSRRVVSIAYEEGLEGAEPEGTAQARGCSAEYSNVFDAQSNGGEGRGCQSHQADGRRWWATEPELGRVANGIPDRVDRLKALGNAVVPQQVYPILKAIADIELSVTKRGNC